MTSTATRTTPDRRPSAASDTGPDAGSGSLRWALSLVLADRRSLGRLLVMAVGVGLCALVLLALVSIGPTIDRSAARSSAITPISVGPPADAGSADTGRFMFSRQTFAADGHHVNGLMLSGGPDAPAPPGTTAFPAAGELLVSPALAAALSGSGADTVRALLPGTVVGTIDPAALAGPGDWFFYAGIGTAAGAAGTAEPSTVAADVIDWNTATGWGADAGHHPLDPEIWVLLLTGAVVMVVPLLLLVALAARLGSIRRRRRTAVLRLLGASPGHVAVLAVAESLVASTAGLMLAGLLFAGARQLAAGVHLDGRGLHPQDVAPGAAGLLAVLVAVPLLAAVAALVGVRAAARHPVAAMTGAPVRATTSSRGRRTRRPGWLRWAAGNEWRLVLLLVTVAVAVWAAIRPRSGRWDEWVDLLWMCGVIVLALAGLAALVGPAVALLCRLLPGRTVAARLAHGRIAMDTSQATRSAAAMAAVIAGAVPLLSLLAASPTVAADSDGPVRTMGFVRLHAPDEWARLQASIDAAGAGPVALADGLVVGNEVAHPDRRVSITVATCGAIAAVWPDADCTAGDIFHRDRDGDPHAPPYRVADDAGASARIWSPPPSTRELAGRADPGWRSSIISPAMDADYLLTPPAAAAQFPTLFAGTHGAWIQLDLTDEDRDAVHRATAWLGPRGYRIAYWTGADGKYAAAVPWIVGALMVCGALTASICLLVQWLSAAEHLLARRRQFALARAAGVPVRTLVGSVLHAALLPAAVAVVLATGVGLLLMQLVDRYRFGDLAAPWAWIGVMAAAGIGTALLSGGVAALTTARQTGPVALRTE